MQRERMPSLVALLRRGQQEFLGGNVAFPKSISMKTKIMNPPGHLQRTLKEFKIHSLHIRPEGSCPLDFQLGGSAWLLALSLVRV